MNLLRLTLISPLLFFSLLLNGQVFKVSYSPGASNETFSGNIFLYLSKDNPNPKDAKVGRVLFPCFRVTANNIKPGATVTFDDAAISYPVALSDIERGEYYVQAVWDNNQGGRSIGNSPGNLYNKAAKVKLTKNHREVFTVICQDVIKPPSFLETDFRKEIRQHSDLLSRFHKQKMTIDAAIILPKEYYEQPQRKFPVLYVVLGYGGDYHTGSGINRPSIPLDTTACIRVILDGNCSQGHCEYANSKNTGPWGDALITELIPAIEKKYRCNAARLLTGHSSGGWATLWLQSRYPKVFVGSWSSAPDPVDFRNFHRVNLYSDRNMFYTEDSTLRMVATVAGRIPWATMKLSYGLENAISRGEQMHSYNAVFSEKGTDGSPRRLCHPLTGEIDSVTVSQWKAYDISLLLRENWSRLQPDLQNKVLVTVGNDDNFFLNESVKLFEEEARKLNTGFVFTYYSGDHFTLSSPEYNLAGYRFLQQKYNDFIK
jgi:hypothetical protein